jgi:hypothetical protein
MTGVGRVTDIVQLPDAEISTDNVTSSLTTHRAAPGPPPCKPLEWDLWLLGPFNVKMGGWKRVARKVIAIGVGLRGR